MTKSAALAPETIDRFLSDHRLPASYVDLVEAWFLPLAVWLESRKTADRCLLLGINGAQGTGKSTLADFIARAAAELYGWHVAVLSIDDFYLTKAERGELAGRVHPLFATRGVPGTHDVSMLDRCLDAIVALAPGQELALPRFDKSVDDRAAESSWPIITGPVNLVVLEGWCVGTTAQEQSALDAPVNELERTEDADRTWRAYVNERLATDYAPVFERLDALVFLRAPGFDQIFEWRLEQEQKLAARAGAGASGIMSADEVRRFIGFYERLTRHNLAHLESRADVVFDLDTGHAVARASYR